ncbi:acyltransferase family protein [Paenibacillus herberti]|uniref:acyltransferase family protein n=1 Tax=Paenibacillus herberti TaxID=1619309 RepID=UPI0015957BE8|nr:acyltransferase family protein [Paenibacillus herberti]
MIREINFLRALSCLFIVMIHCVEKAKVKYGFFDDLDDSTQFYADLLMLLLKVGTGIFVFISEFILAYKYPDKLPEGFYLKRVKFLLIPLFVMSVVFAYVDTRIGGTGWFQMLKEFILNLFLGGFHGYFILIIFQFYILHGFWIRYVKRYKPLHVLLLMLLINISYLSLFNFVQPPIQSERMNHLWYVGSSIPLFGWLFYFALAYYCGSNYEWFMKKLAALKYYILGISILAFSLSMLIQKYDIITVQSSKRVDMIFLTSCSIMLMFLWARKINYFPKWMSLVSNYSFGIYWLHLFFIAVLSEYINFKSNYSYLLYIPLMFIVSILFSIISTELLQKIPFGVYVVGKTRQESKTAKGSSF